MGSIREFRDSSPESRDRTEIMGRSDIHSGLHLNRNGKHQGIQGISPLTPRDRTEITGRSDIHSGLHLNRNGKHQGIQGFLP